MTAQLTPPPESQTSNVLPQNTKGGLRRWILTGILALIWLAASQSVAVAIVSGALALFSAAYLMRPGIRTWWAANVTASHFPARRILILGALSVALCISHGRAGRDALATIAEARQLHDRGDLEGALKRLDHIEDASSQTYLDSLSLRNQYRQELGDKQEPDAAALLAEGRRLLKDKGPIDAIPVLEKAARFSESPSGQLAATLAYNSRKTISEEGKQNAVATAHKQGLGWSLGQVTRTMPVFSKSQPSRESRPEGTTAYVWRLDSGLNPAAVGQDAVVITLLGPDDDLSRVQCDLLLPVGTPDNSVIKDRLIVGSAFLTKISGLSFEEVTKWVGSGAEPEPKVIGDNVITCTLGPSRITYTIDPK